MLTVGADTGSTQECNPVAGDAFPVDLKYVPLLGENSSQRTVPFK